MYQVADDVVPNAPSIRDFRAITCEATGHLTAVKRQRSMMRVALARAVQRPSW